MPKIKKKSVQTLESKPEKRDIITEMFEHFGIKVVNVTIQSSKLNKKRLIK